MLPSVDFQTQLVSIIDILAKAAVAEISKLIEDGSAVWKFEISRHQKENEALKRKVHLLESELKASRQCSQNNDRLQESLVNCRSDIAQSEDIEEYMPDIIFLKAERTEDDVPNDIQEGWKVPCESALQSGPLRPAGRSDPIDLQSPSEEVKPQSPAAEQQGIQIGLLVHRRPEARPKAEQESEPQTWTMEQSARELGTASGMHTGHASDACRRGTIGRGDTRDSHLSGLTEEYAVVEMENVTLHPVRQKCGSPEAQRATCGARRVTCMYCGKCFPYLSYLKRHVRVHTGEKPYGCAHCGKRFSDGSSRRKHEGTHTGRRPFLCPQCGKRFSRRCHLKRHQKIHATKA